MHQTGEAEHQAVVERYESLGIDADIRPYIDDMASAYANADLAITRAGASSVAELAASGTPSILVPFPYAADDHQAANAQALEASGGARMIRQSDWDDAEVQQWVRSLIDSKELLSQMASAALGAAKPQAAKSVVDGCVDLMAQSGTRLLSWVG